MPEAPDPITHKKLLLVKQLYHRAIAQVSSLLNPVDRILAVVGLDLCIETQLKTIVSSLDSSKVPADGFQGLIQQADSVLEKEGLTRLPDMATIQFVHSTRNDAQHKAKYPNEADVNDARTYTRDFLRKTSSSVWNLDFDTLSLASTVQDDDARNRLLQAEEALRQDQPADAALAAAAALTGTVSRVESAVVGHLPSVAQGILVTSAFNVSSDSDSRQALAAIQRMQDTLLYVALRMDFTQFMRFRSLVGEVYFTANGQVHSSSMKQDIDLREAEWVVAYCIDSVLKVEETVGSIDAPFGRKWWP
jgi:hypothetical protein